jgi:hypothetical protein
MGRILRQSAVVLALVFVLSAAGLAPAAEASAGNANPSAGANETALAVLEAGGGDASASLEPEDGTDGQDPGSANGVEDYDQVEKAGEVAGPSEYGFDGWIDHFKNGYLFGQVDSVVELRMKHGHKAVLGSDYVVFREDGELGEEVGSGQDAGMLLQNVAVLRVTRVDGDTASARILKLYSNVLQMDLVRLREPQRAKYYALLDRKPAGTLKGLDGEVVGMLPPTLFAVRDDVVYLNVGLSKGLALGTRLTVLGDLDPDDFGADDIDSLMPMSPIPVIQPTTDDMAGVAPTGGIATLEVVNASEDACVARVIDCVGDVRVGDHVRYP